MKVYVLLEYQTCCDFTMVEVVDVFKERTDVENIIKKNKYRSYGIVEKELK